MCKSNFFNALNFLIASLFLMACQPPELSQMRGVPESLLGIVKKTTMLENISNAKVEKKSPKPLSTILNGSLANKNEGSDFKSAMRYALVSDPLIVSKRRDMEAKLAAVGSIRARKDFQIGTTLYGGIEDVTDKTRGVALAVNASRLVFDGGKLDSEIDSALFSAEAAKMDLTATLDKRAYELGEIWLELDKYKTLQSQIDKRLAVLDPLIEQLEKVAKAGIGDVSKVTAAQRTVSAIRVEQTSVAEALAQAKLEFLNAFGSILQEISFDYDFLTKLVPEKVDSDGIKQSPLLLSKYANYQASVARVNALKAKEGFDVGFEARAMRPFAGSGYDSDESIGLVGRKTLFNGGMLGSEIKEAAALVEANAEQIKATYRVGTRSVQTAIQNIESMNKAILIARNNAKLTLDEIIYLRRQLVIGASTLDSVLSAEARLYEAEAKEIRFLTEKYKSELLVVSSLGLLSRALGVHK